MLSEVTDKGVIVKAKDGSTFEIEGDTVLISAGYIPTPAFPQDKHVHLVGDCNGVGNLRTVIWRAWTLPWRCNASLRKEKSYGTYQRTASHT